MLCSKCGKEINEDFAMCPYCGETVVTEKVYDVADTANTDSAETPVSGDSSVSAAPENQMANPSTPENPKSKKSHKKIIIPIAAALAVCIIGAVIAVSIIAGKPGRELKKANALFDEEQYKEAIELYIEYAEKDSDLEKLEKAVESVVNDYLDNGKYTDATNYIKSLSEMNLNDDTAEFVDTIGDKIMYEALAIYAASQVRESYKRPSSFELNSVEFYYPDSNDYNYYFIIADTSGQNGFGGISSSYTIFTAKEIEVIGSINSNDVDDPDDYYDSLIAKALKTYWSKTPVCDKVNVMRITKLLNEGVDYDVNIELYKISPAVKGEV